MLALSAILARWIRINIRNSLALRVLHCFEPILVAWSATLERQSTRLFSAVCDIALLHPIELHSMLALSPILER